MSTERFDAAVVGGGFFGCYFADHLARSGRSVVILEREWQLIRAPRSSTRPGFTAATTIRRSLLTESGRLPITSASATTSRTASTHRARPITP